MTYMLTCRLVANQLHGHSWFDIKANFVFYLLIYELFVRGGNGEGVKIKTHWKISLGPLN